MTRRILLASSGGGGGSENIDPFFGKVLTLTFNSDGPLDKIYYNGQVVTTSLFTVFNIGNTGVFSDLSSEYSFILPLSSSEGTILPARYNQYNGNLVDAVYKWNSDQVSNYGYNSRMLDLLSGIAYARTNKQYNIVVTSAHTGVEFVVVGVDFS